MFSRVLSAICVLLCLSVSQAGATHLMAGEIHVSQEDCSSLEVQITLIVYVNLSSTVVVGGIQTWLDFGDGTGTELPELADINVLDNETGIGVVTFTTTHVYTAVGKYTIVYTEPNRNEGVVNIENSPQTPFRLEAQMSIDSSRCNSGPSLLVPPIDRACSGSIFFHNPGAVDSDGDSLSFELIMTPGVTNYRFPNHENFYTNFETGNEAATGPPVFLVDPVTGTIKWDAPGMMGSYAIALKIVEWRFQESDSTWQSIGYVIRDMQVIVDNCSDNQRPLLEPQEDLCVTAGETIQFTLTATDPNGDLVFVEAFSDAFFVAGNSPTTSPSNGTPQATASPNDTAKFSFFWVTACDHVRDRPYQFVFKISDKPENGPRQVQFQTVNIKIIAPEPVYDDVNVNPITKSVTLGWDGYPCENVEAFQIWRRVSMYPYQQPECENGMPYFLHYQLLTVVPGNQFEYTDEGLSHGALYCYRIVALVGAARTPSRMSLDTCLIPKPAEAPVITNVSITDTDQQDGAMTIRWTHPFDIDKIQYPSPYQYRVFRKEDGESDNMFLPVSPLVSDTVFEDHGINSAERSFRYRVELYVPALTNLPVDTSSQASSAYLSATPQLTSIALDWEANTPWYNYALDYPYHLVFRKTGQSSDFMLIDSVDVNLHGFHYVDSGQFANTPLQPYVDYYYKVLTRGTYGNPSIIAPIENFSQITVAQLLDIIPPCSPSLSIAAIDCQELPCRHDAYYNLLEWENPGADCASDVVAYEILVSQDQGHTFEKLATLTGYSFQHDNLTSRELCYRVISIDVAGNRSDSSGMVCGSNCVNFRLPNVITPGNDDGKNDNLEAYSSSSSSEDCPRSVQRVGLSIFNRLGKEVFTTSAFDSDQLIFWDGRSNSGSEVAAGVYFYSATVLYNTTDPVKKVQDVKGWIHVIR